jgi:DNA-binding NarL/FixJ family response regulator
MNAAIGGSGQMGGRRVVDSEIRVIVVDDHELFRSGLVELLRERGIQVLAEAGTAFEGIRLATELKPDVILMDLNMPGMSGIEATECICAAAPRTRVLVLTVVAEEPDVMEAVLAGACGYLLKDSPIDQVVAAIKGARKETTISPRIASLLVQRLRATEETPPVLTGSKLTAREREVLELLALGKDNSEIAEALYLSPHTIKHCVSSILVKLQVENRVQAAVRAVRDGLV